jgi:hypothetical protein
MRIGILSAQRNCHTSGPRFRLLLSRLPCCIPASCIAVATRRDSYAMMQLGSLDEVEVNCFAAAMITSVQIRPLQQQLLRFQSLPQPCNHPNLINDNVKFVQPRSHRSGQRLSPNRVGREEDRGAALNASFFFRRLLLTTSRREGVSSSWTPRGVLQWINKAILSRVLWTC